MNAEFWQGLTKQICGQLRWTDCLKETKQIYKGNLMNPAIYSDLAICLGQSEMERGKESSPRTLGPTVDTILTAEEEERKTPDPMGQSLGSLREHI